MEKSGGKRDMRNGKLEGVINRRVLEPRKCKGLMGMKMAMGVAIALTAMVGLSSAVTVDIAPDAFNLDSLGTWVTAYIEGPVTLFEDHEFDVLTWTPSPEGPCPWSPNYKIGGVWAVGDGEYSGSVPGGSGGIAGYIAVTSAGDNRRTDYAVEAKIFPYDAYWRAGIYFRYVDNSNLYIAHTYEDGMRLARVVNGVGFAPNGWWIQGRPIPSNAWHTLRVEVSGNPAHIKMYVNGELKFDATDTITDLPAGRIALSVWDERNAVHVHFDDVLVTTDDICMIDPTTIQLWYPATNEFIVGVDPAAPTSVGDYDDDGIPDLMVKFDRATLAKFLREKGIPSGTEIQLAVKGTDIYGGTGFDGTDSMKVISKGKVKI